MSFWTSHCQRPLFKYNIVLTITITNKLADIGLRDSNCKDSTKPGWTSPSAEKASSAARQYLPGGIKYNNFLSSRLGDMPRGHKSVPEWLDEWERKWDAITDSSTLNSMAELVTSYYKFADVAKKSRNFDLKDIFSHVFLLSFYIDPWMWCFFFLMDLS